MRRAHLLLLVPLLLGTCTRPTPGFCNTDTDCTVNDDGQLCLLPDHQCTTATHRGELSGSQQVPPTASDYDGSLRMLLVMNGAGANLTWSLIHTVPNPMAAHIHAGTFGQAGPIVFTLGTQSGSTGVIQLPPDKIEILQSGAYYADIHTGAFPGGEVRAQIFPLVSPQPGTFKLSGKLSGLEETPPNNSAASGHTEMTFDEKAGTIAYTANHNLNPAVSGPITGIHIHRGHPNFDGPHVVDLPLSQNPSISGTVTMDTVMPPQLAIYPILVKSGLAYLNIHTMNHSGGELRAQLLLDSSQPFDSVMDGNLVAPAPVQSATQAVAFFYLSADQTNLAYRLSYADSSQLTIMGAHIHQGAPGATGNIVCTLGMGQDDVEGACPVKSSNAGPNDLALSDLLGGHLYVDVHTMAHPNGELRGQLIVPGT